MNEQTKSSVVENIVTYVILPMLQLNKSSFGTDNFINSYLDKDGYIIVNIKEEPKVDFLTHPQYVTDFNKEDGTLMLVFSVPSVYKDDLPLFIDGKYSELSSELKIAITKYAGIKNTSLVIRMLNPSKDDRQKLADELGVKIDNIKEIKSKPTDSNYIKIK